MDTSHIMIMVAILSIFSISGLVCGLILYGEVPKYIQDTPTVRACLIVLIASLCFVVLFNIIYFGWHLMHNHKFEQPRQSTRMR